MFYYIVFVHCQLFWTWGFPEIDSETAELEGSPKDFYEKKVLYLRLDYTEELCARATKRCLV
ncbi:MAG: hypothetical protein O2V44_04040, partial [Candidatus Bathyarchaeota archaeon]|nr:hypothetical protein [Candidatus Bathyarchaeota archaeon]